MQAFSLNVKEMALNAEQDIQDTKVSVTCQNHKLDIKNKKKMQKQFVKKIQKEEGSKPAIKLMKPLITQNSKPQSKNMHGYKITSKLPKTVSTERKAGNNVLPLQS